MLNKIKNWLLKNENNIIVALGVAYITVTISAAFMLIVYICGRII